MMPLLEALVEDRQGIGEQVTLNGNTAAVLLSWNRLRSAFENVVDNALRYGDCADIEVHHERDSEGREWLYIDFRDNGPGIPEEKLEFVLEPYVRLETSRNRKTGGHGLGLSIVRNLVEASGGRVLLMNRPGRGAFWSGCCSHSSHAGRPSWVNRREKPRALAPYSAFRPSFACFHKKTRPAKFFGGLFLFQAQKNDMQRK